MIVKCYPETSCNQRLKSHLTRNGFYRHMKIKWYFISILTLIVSYLLCISLHAVAADSDSKRWGIVTKNPVDQTEPPSKEDEKATDDKNKASAETPSTEAISADQKKENLTTKPSATEASDKKMQKTTPSEKPQSSKTPTSGSKAGQPIKEKITWADEKQEQTCNGYLEQLQEQFLKTRHYSIQGVPCKTADHAETFLQIADKCDKECPKGFVEASGYTSRIMRNIRFLGKLGNDKCTDTLPVTKSNPKTIPDTSQPKN